MDKINKELLGLNARWGISGLNTLIPFPSVAFHLLVLMPDGAFLV